MKGSCLGGGGVQGRAVPGLQKRGCVGLALMQGRALGLLVWKGGASSPPDRQLSHGSNSVGCAAREQWAGLRGLGVLPLVPLCQ